MPVQVTGMSLGSTQWFPAFYAQLPGAGLGTTDGITLLPGVAPQELPYSNLNRVVIHFSGNVNVQQGNLSVTGSTGLPYGIGSFSYNPTTFTGIWTLSQMIARDTVTISLAGVAAMSGGVSVRTTVLPGDTNRDGIVNFQDLAAITSHWLQPDPQIDIAGVGLINSRDVTAVASNMTLLSGSGDQQPVVSSFLVSSTQWTTTFDGQLATYGLGTTDGISLLSSTAPKELPYSGLNRIVVHFSGNITVQQGDLVVTGSNGSQYSIASFSYNAATFTAVWTLAQSLGNDKVTFALSHPSSTGTNVSIATRILPGDVNLDGIVNFQDLAKISSNWMRVNPSIDIAGAGLVNGRDLAAVVSNMTISVGGAGNGNAAGSDVSPLTSAALVVGQSGSALLPAAPQALARALQGHSRQSVPLRWMRSLLRRT